MNDWSPFWVSLRVTALASLLILGVGLTVGVVLSRWRWRGRWLLDALFTLPLVLPPTVIGYYLLLAFGRNSFIYEVLGVRLLFTWEGASIAGAIVGLPMMIHATQSALRDVDKDIQDSARVDGASEWRILWRVTLPIARRGIVAGFVLATARAMGDFGATLMIAGNLQGRTRTLSLAIYDAVQSFRYEEAQFMVMVMSAFAFGVVWVVYRLTGTTRP